MKLENMLKAVNAQQIIGVLIKKFDFKTPGREDDDTETKLYTKADVNERKAAKDVKNF